MKIEINIKKSVAIILLVVIFASLKTGNYNFNDSIQFLKDKAVIIKSYVMDTYYLITH